MASRVDRTAFGFVAALAIAGAVLPNRSTTLGPALALLATIPLTAAWARRSRGGRIVHDFLPIAIVVGVFELVGPIVDGMGRPLWDGTLAAIDERRFAAVAAAWRDVLGRPSWLTEVAYVSYLSFYAMPIAIAVALYVQPSRPHFEAFAFELMTCFLVAFSFYVAFPAIGPRVADADADVVLGGSTVARAARAFLRVVERNRYDAFPSGHVALALVMVALVSRTLARWRGVLAACVVGIVFSTVYLSYHYVVDVVAGVALAALLGALVLALRAVAGRTRTRGAAPDRERADCGGGGAECAEGSAEWARALRTKLRRRLS